MTQQQANIDHYLRRIAREVKAARTANKLGSNIQADMRNVASLVASIQNEYKGTLDRVLGETGH